MMKNRKIISFTIVLAVAITLLLGFSPSSVKAAEEESIYESIIWDYENLLTDEEEEALSEDMSRLLPYGNVIFLTVELSEQTGYEEYAEDTYYSQFGNEPGVIFQIDMGHRKLTLSSSTDMDDMIKKERDTIVDNVYRHATDEEYYRCASRCFDEIYEVINDGEIAHTMKHVDNAILAVIFSLIINFIIVFAGTKKKATTGEIIAAMAVATAVTATSFEKGELIKEYSPRSSGSSGSGGSGGGGGGFSGGSSSHGF